MFDRENKKRLLFVSYHHSYPFFADSIQNHRLLDELKKEIDIDILCRSNSSASNCDGILSVWSPNLSLADTVFLKLFPHLRPVYSLDRYLWSFLAFAKLLFLKKKYDAVLLTYEPYAIYPLSVYLRKFFSLNIISVLYDPLADNLFFHQSSKGINVRLKLEKKIIETSYAVVVNNEIVKDKLEKRYKVNHIKMIYLCGRDIAYSDSSALYNQNRKIRIVHCGNVHGKRNLKCLDETVSILKQNITELSEKLEVVLYGECSPVEKQRIYNSQNTDVIILKPSVSSEEISKKVSSADALLLIDPLDEGNNSFPSKLCEYFQYGKFIFGYSNLNSPSGSFLLKAKQFVCDGSNIDDMAEALGKFIKDKHVYDSLIPKDYGRQFNPAYIADQYMNILNDI